MFETFDHALAPTHPELSELGRKTWWEIRRTVNLPWLHCEVTHYEGDLCFEDVHLFNTVDDFLLSLGSMGARIKQLDLVAKDRNDRSWKMHRVSRIWSVLFEDNPDYLVEIDGAQKLLVSKNIVGVTSQDISQVTEQKLVFSPMDSDEQLSSLAV